MITMMHLKYLDMFQNRQIIIQINSHTVTCNFINEQKSFASIWEATVSAYHLFKRFSILEEICKMRNKGKKQHWNYSKGSFTKKY